MHPSSDKPLVFGLTEINCRTPMSASKKNAGGAGGSCIQTLQELTGNFIRKQVEEERKDVIRKHSVIFDSKRIELELKQEKLQRQMREVEEQMKSVEIDCHKDMLTELDQFDNEIQPEKLDVLTDTGQLDRICPLCEKYFRSSTDLPTCCLGREGCHLHTVQRCCFSCSRLSFYDIFQCLALCDYKGGKRSNDELMGGLGLVEDLASLESAATTPSWMLEQIFGEEAESIGQENKDEYEESATTITAAAVRLVPSESGSVTCPVCHHQFCDHDFLYHFAPCCRQAQTDNQCIDICSRSKSRSKSRSE
jgi:hypothetical protein